MEQEDVGESNIHMHGEHLSWITLKGQVSTHTVQCLLDLEGP